MLCIHVNAKTIGKTIITKVADKGVQYLMLRLYVNFKTTLTPYSLSHIRQEVDMHVHA